MRKLCVVFLLVLTYILCPREISSSVCIPDLLAHLTQRVCGSEVLDIAESYLGNERKYLILAIAQVETGHGQNLGKYRTVKVANRTQLKYLRKISERLHVQSESFHGSSAGALGYMQIMPQTWWQYQQDGNGDGVKDPRDPRDSIAAASLFLSRMIQEEGSVSAGVLRYNRSKTYVKKVINLTNKLKQQYD